MQYNPNLRGEMRLQYRNMLERLDNDIKEIEEIRKETDKALYEFERRIAKLRSSGGE